MRKWDFGGHARTGWSSIGDYVLVLTMVFDDSVEGGRSTARAGLGWPAVSSTRRLFLQVQTGRMCATGINSRPGCCNASHAMHHWAPTAVSRPIDSPLAGRARFVRFRLPTFLGHKNKTSYLWIHGPLSYHIRSGPWVVQVIPGKASNN